MKCKFSSLFRAPALRRFGVAGIAVVALTAGSAPAQACDAQPPGLVLWLAGDGNFKDIAGPNNGTAQNGATFAAGEVGQAMSFDGANDGVAFNPAATTFQLTSLTLQAWINLQSFNTAFGDQVIFQRGDDRFNADPYNLTVVNSSQTLIFQIESASAVAAVSVPISSGSWKLVTATFDGGTGLMRVYIDGAKVGETTTAVQPILTLDSTLHPFTGLGNFVSPGPENAPFNGLIDEFQLYNRALNQSEIQAIFNAGATGVCKPALTINNVTHNEGNSGTANDSFTVTLTPPTSQTVTVNYATANGTATSGSDYAAKSGTLTFSPGQTSKSVTVAVNGDTTAEPNETFFVNLSSASNATIADAQGKGTIVNDDPGAGLPSLAIDNVGLNEGNSGTKSFTFHITLSAPSAQTVTVNFATGNGSATAPSDYTTSSGSRTFTPGQTSKAVTVLVNGDTTVEANETFKVNLSGATNATIADSQGIGTITNDDPGGLPTLSVTDVTKAEGTGTTPTYFNFTLTLSKASTQTITVNYATADGTAIAGEDYTARNGTSTFQPGQISKSVSIAVTADAVVEPNQSFFLKLSSPVNATIADTTGVGNITNDDGVLTSSD